MTFTYYKGAPERLIDAATKCVTLNGLEPIDKDKLKMIVRSYTVKAMRVIATGYSSSKLPEDGFPNDLIIISLVAIRDDVRPEVPEAVAKMHDAGVQVMMVTGDVIDTAKAIAKDAGLITSESDIQCQLLTLMHCQMKRQKKNFLILKLLLEQHQTLNVQF